MLKTTVAVAMLLTAGAANANVLTNGSFEQPTITDSCCNTVGAGGSFPGWTVGSGDINVVNGTFASNNGNLAFAGSQYLDLIGQSGGGSLTQSFATILNKTYNLSFVYSHNIFGGLPSASAAYSVGGLSGTVTHVTGDRSDLDWQRVTGQFVGTGNPLSLTFTNTVGDGNAGVLLDAVSVVAVPEPATWAMMIGGFGAVGGAMRTRRRRSGVLATA